MPTVAPSSPPSRDDGGRVRSGSGWDPAFVAGSPLFHPLVEVASAFAAEPVFPSPAVIDRALASRAGVRFVEAVPRPRRRRRRERRLGDAPPSTALYDARITRAGEVPTRPGSWHDFLNALVWATFPRSKRALHARQHALVVPARPGESQRRPRALDALALLDEGGVVVVAGPATGRGALVDEAALAAAVRAGHAAVVVFGHAVYEGLVHRWPTPTVSATVVDVPEGHRSPTLASVDAALAAVLADPSTFAHPRELARLDLACVPPRGGDDESGSCVAPKPLTV